MAKSNPWHDDFWPLLMQVYKQKPVGVKPLYSKAVVDVSIELHIPPQEIFARLCQIANQETPATIRLWELYGDNNRRLKRDAERLRSMEGFGAPKKFYDGVNMVETFEKDFKPLAEDSRLTPVMLILVLDLYFRLTPITMVPQTPEVAELAQLLKLSPQLVADVLDVFQHCDPYLNRKDVTFSPLLLPCTQLWQRFGNADTRQLASFAEQLSEYFKN